MITQDTAERIWGCYREIQAAEQILKDMAEVVAVSKHDGTEPRLKDVFGRQHDLQLGVPSGHDSHQLFGVSPKLAESVIRAHIAAKQKELVEANETARFELEAP
jgi:hypothetical protein